MYMSHIYQLVISRKFVSFFLAVLSFSVIADTASNKSINLTCKVITISNGIKQQIQNCQIKYESSGRRMLTDCFSPSSSPNEFLQDSSYENNKFKVVKRIANNSGILKATSYIEVKELNTVSNNEIEIDLSSKQFKGNSVGPFGYSDIVGSCY